MGLIKLGDVCDFQGGTQPPKEEWVNKPLDGYVRMLQIRDFTQAKEEHIEYVKDSKKLNKCQEQDILIGRYGASVGKILTGLSGAYNVAIIKTIPIEEKLTKKFLYYLLVSPSFQNFIQNIGGRAAQAGFNKEDISNYKIFLPSLEEQKHIAEVLSKAEALIAGRKQSIQLLDAYLKSTFLEMFGDPMKNEKGWKKDYFESLVAGDCPLTYGIVQPGEEFVNGVPVIRPVDLTKTYIDRVGLKLIDPKISEKFKRTLLKGNEILMCVRGTTGIVSLASKELKGCNVTRGIVPIWFSKSYNTFFAFGLLKSKAINNEIQNLTYGATLQQINLSDLRKIKLINPPIELQTKFATIVEKVEVLKSQYLQSLVELQNTYGVLSQRAFKGELGLNDK